MTYLPTVEVIANLVLIGSNHRLPGRNVRSMPTHVGDARRLRVQGVNKRSRVLRKE